MHVVSGREDFPGAHMVLSRESYLLHSGDSIWEQLEETSMLTVRVYRNVASSCHLILDPSNTFH